MVKEGQDIMGSNCQKGVAGKVIVDEMQSAGPFLTPADILRSHSLSSFISFSMNL